MYSSNSFIVTNTNPNARTIKIVDTSGNNSLVINVCHSQKSVVGNKQIMIISNNFNTPKILEFASESEAILAYDKYLNELYRLKVNCPEYGSGGGGGSDYEGPTLIKTIGTDWTITLPQTYPISPLVDLTNNKVDVYLNGQKLVRTNDYELMGNLVTILNGGYKIDPQDIVEIVVF